MRWNMRTINNAILIILVFASLSSGQLYQEGVFGLNTPADCWSWRTDVTCFGAPYEGRFGQASAVANISFASAEDTTDIVLIVNCHQSVIHWLRASAGLNPRALQHLGTYGEFGNGPGQFIDLYSMAVATTSDLFDPATDHIFVGDRMTHRIDRLNFEFYPEAPQSDRIFWESSTSIDSTFSPIDLEYVDYGSGNRYDNKLFALDDMGGRLAVFTHDGELSQIFDLADPADTLLHIYRAFAVRVNPNGSVTFYLADINHTNVRRYRYSAQGQLSFVNELNLGDRLETTLSDVVYSDRIGLWAVESRGPHLYKLAENLSQVLFEVSGEDFDPPSLFYIHKIAVLPERIVVFEQMGAETGLMTFAFDPPSGKRETEQEEIIPYKFELSQNYPNPFNPNTTIKFEIPHAGLVRLEIFNILGQRVTRLVDEYRSAGPHSVIWDGTNGSGKQVSTGIYFTRLSSGDKTEIKKMLLLR
jgi:hypothetical protein